MPSDPNQPIQPTRLQPSRGLSGVAMPTRRGRRTSFGSPLEEIRDEMDRLWSEFTSAAPAPAWSPLVEWGFAPDGGRGLPTGVTGFPSVNASETPEAIVVEAELPGVTSTDLDVSVAGPELVIKGRRPPREEPSEPKAGERPAWLRRERATGDFERRIELPVAIDPDKVEARLSDGVLTLRCVKAAECQPHKIEIRS